MMSKLNRLICLPISTTLMFCLFSCSDKAIDNKQVGNDDTYDIDAKGIPRFVNVDYIELDKIARISKFRSAEGHDYSDDLESCRSMKHYFNPQDTVDWSAIGIYAPVSGTVSVLRDEWAGTQVVFRPSEYPAFAFIIFHIDLSTQLKVGDQLSAGQQLGTHIGSQTMSDIAVGVDTPDGWRLISYFEVLADAVFQAYQDRGLTSRTDVIISRAARDADPLGCNGETFIDRGNLDNWVYLE